MNVAQGILIVMFFLLAFVQWKLWQMLVLPVYLLPVGAFALVTGAAGSIVALVEDYIPMLFVWVPLLVAQMVVLGILCIGALFGRSA